MSGQTVYCTCVCACACACACVCVCVDMCEGGKEGGREGGGRGVMLILLCVHVSGVQYVCAWLKSVYRCFKCMCIHCMNFFSLCLYTLQVQSFSREQAAINSGVCTLPSSSNSSISCAEEVRVMWNPLYLKVLSALHFFLSLLLILSYWNLKVSTMHVPLPLPSLSLSPSFSLYSPSPSPSPPPPPVSLSPSDTLKAGQFAKYVSLKSRQILTLQRRL